jgi:hypothetical protein
MRKGLDESRAMHGRDVFQHMQAIRFARLAGCFPAGDDLPDDLAALLDANAVTALSMRLTGPDALPDATDLVSADARRYGCKDPAVV